MEQTQSANRRRRSSVEEERTVEETSTAVADDEVTGVEPVDPEPEIVNEVPEPPVEVRVRYIGGQGIILAYPLSDGRREFKAGVVYTLKNYGDFVRLRSTNKHFIEVRD